MNAREVITPKQRLKGDDKRANGDTYKELVSHKAQVRRSWRGGEQDQGHERGGLTCQKRKRKRSESYTVAEKEARELAKGNQGMHNDA